MSFEADKDSHIHSVSVDFDAGDDDLSTVFSCSSLSLSVLPVVEHSTTCFFIDDNDEDTSSELSLSSSNTPVMPADVDIVASHLC